MSESAARFRLDRPPPDDAYVDLPEDFGRRFTVFVDTEEEFDWTRPLRRDGYGTAHVRAIPEFQRRMSAAGVKPVYLIDFPIATDPAAAEILSGFQDAGECAVGTQLHPWVNPPFEEEVNPFNSFAGNLPVELERAKLVRLTEAIEAGVGRRPRVYRAGRYGVGPNTAGLLVEAGYKADCSVRPLHEYRSQGGPDFGGIATRPYWLGPLLEIPLSAAYIGALGRWGARLYPSAGRVPRAHGALARARLLSRVSLSPEGMPLEEAKRAAALLLEKGARLLSFSFHSPSLEPGHTPYVRSPAELDLFYRWWDGMLDFLAARGVAPASIEEAIAAAEAGREG